MCSRLLYNSGYGMTESGPLVLVGPKGSAERGHSRVCHTKYPRKGKLKVNISRN